MASNVNRAAFAQSLDQAAAPTGPRVVWRPFPQLLGDELRAWVVPPDLSDAMTRSSPQSQAWWDAYFTWVSRISGDAYASGYKRERSLNDLSTALRTGNHPDSYLAPSGASIFDVQQAYLRAAQQGFDAAANPSSPRAMTTTADTTSSSSVLSRIVGWIKATFARLWHAIAGSSSTDAPQQVAGTENRMRPHLSTQGTNSPPVASKYAGGWILQQINSQIAVALTDAQADLAFKAARATPAPSGPFHPLVPRTHVHEQTRGQYWLHNGRGLGVTLSRAQGQAVIQALDGARARNNAVANHLEQLIAAPMATAAHATLTHNGARVNVPEDTWRNAIVLSAQGGTVDASQAPALQAAVNVLQISSDPATVGQVAQAASTGDSNSIMVATAIIQAQVVAAKMLAEEIVFGVVQGDPSAMAMAQQYLAGASSSDPGAVLIARALEQAIDIATATLEASDSSGNANDDGGGGDVATYTDELGQTWAMDDSGNAYCLASDGQIYACGQDDSGQLVCAPALAA